VIRELIAKRTLDSNMGIQNSLPTFKYLMVLRVFQPRANKTVEIEPNAAFDIMISQFTLIPKVFFIKTHDIHYEFKHFCITAQH